MPTGWRVSSLGCLLLIRSLCPSGVVRSPLPAPRVAYSGRAAGRVCRAVVRCGLACRLSLAPPCRSAGRWAACPSFLVSWLSAGGGSLALRGSSRLIDAGGGTGSSACLDEADVGVCGLCGASFYRLITSVETGILFLVP